MSRRRCADGFTLVEVAVALSGAGLLAAGLMSILSGQARFQTRNDDAVLVRQNVRALADIMVPEIRAASPDDIVLADPDQLGVRSDILRAVVCDVPGAGSADVFVYDSVSTANLPRGFRGTAVTGPYDGVFAYADGFTPAAIPHAGAEASCRAHGADAGGVAPRSAFRRIGTWTGSVAVPSERGSIIRVYGMLEYALGPSSSDPGALAVRRNGQELATPFAPGARFEYVLSDGSVHSQVGAANLSDIRTVRVIAQAATRGRSGAGRQVSFDVLLHD